MTNEGVKTGMNRRSLDRLTSLLIGMSAISSLAVISDPRPACAQEGPRRSREPATTARATASAAAPAAFDSILDLDDYRGRVVYLDFWASWCNPCRKAFPWMDALHKQYADRGLAVVAVNLDRDRKSAEAFLAENPASFRVVYDPEGSLATEYQLEGLPSSFLIDRLGAVRDRHVGFRKEDSERMRAEVLALLQEKAPAPPEETPAHEEDRERPDPGQGERGRATP
jgi:thiol-disulfide isomerase/thioredoxin